MGLSSRDVARSAQIAKINFDAAYCKKRNKSSSGVIIRDASGKVLHENIPSPFAVEAMACLQVVELGLHVDLTTVEVEGDSLTVIQKLQREEIERCAYFEH